MKYHFHPNKSLNLCTRAKRQNQINGSCCLIWQYMKIATFASVVIGAKLSGKIIAASCELHDSPTDVNAIRVFQVSGI